jgi:hypothetical protein
MNLAVYFDSRLVAGRQKGATMFEPSVAVEDPHKLIDLVAMSYRHEDDLFIFHIDLTRRGKRARVIAHGSGPDPEDYELELEGQQNTDQYETASVHFKLCSEDYIPFAETGKYTCFVCFILRDKLMPVSENILYMGPT